MFDDVETFKSVKKSGVLPEKAIAELYGIPLSDVLACLLWDPAQAFKATIKQPVVSGSFESLDAQGSGQHAPLLYTILPIPRAVT